MSSTPDVSVVVPTYSRPDLVVRAVRSALAQTIRNIEVVVVVDGPEDATTRELSTIVDPRLRVIALPRQLGAPHARNVGAREARAPWTALLDDDDEWLPHKLEVQLGLARTATVSTPIIASRLVNRTPRAEFVLPRRLPAPGEPLSEYLTVRRGLFHGDGFIQTSTIMAPTELLRRVPFSVGLRRLQELDWTLRAASHDDVDLIVASEPLVVWHTDENRPRVSFDLPWQQQLEWLRRSQPLFTPRAYAALTMSVISSMAAPTRDTQIFRTLLREARRHGRPSAIDYVTLLQVWLVPPQVRAKVRDLVLARRRPTHPAASRSGVPAGAGTSAASDTTVEHAPARTEWRTTAPSDRVDTRR